MSDYFIPVKACDHFTSIPGIFIHCRGITLTVAHINVGRVARTKLLRSHTSGEMLSAS